MDKFEAALDNLSGFFQDILEFLRQIFEYFESLGGGEAEEG